MENVGKQSLEIDESYRLLPSVYLALLSLWMISACFWTLNTARHFQILILSYLWFCIVVVLLEQTSRLQWMLALVPLAKALQLVQSFLFWYSCFYHHVCSLWMSFGVYISGVLFQTVSFISFFLIAHGYGIVSERLSLIERRATAALGCVFYLTLVGYNASIPYFTVLLVINYVISFYLIFHQIYQNLTLLRYQLTSVEDEGIQTMREAVYVKYTMFKKFQAAMQILVLAEIVLHVNMDNSPETYWVRLLIKEWAKFCIYLYIGWTFRSQLMAPFFSVMPAVKSRGGLVPPIYVIEMDAASFKHFSTRDWQIGVPTSASHESSRDSIVVVVQHPHTQTMPATTIPMHLTA